jgi:hypothetical protein
MENGHRFIVSFFHILGIASGKRLQQTMERSTIFNGKTQLKMVIFNSYVKLPYGKWP